MFCWSINFNFTKVKCFLPSFLFLVFNPSLKFGVVNPGFAPLSDLETVELFSLCTPCVAGADKGQAAGGLLGGSIQATADGAVIISRPASERVKEKFCTVGFLCSCPQEVQLDCNESPQIKAYREGTTGTSVKVSEASGFNCELSLTCLLTAR